MFENLLWKWNPITAEILCCFKQSYMPKQIFRKTQLLKIVHYRKLWSSKFVTLQINLQFLLLCTFNYCYFAFNKTKTLSKNDREIEFIHCLLTLIAELPFSHLVYQALQCICGYHSDLSYTKPVKQMSISSLDINKKPY